MMYFIAENFFNKHFYKFITMLVDKFALSTIRMYDKIESLTSTLTDLRRFVETHVSERDYFGLGYKSRDKFVDDVVDAVVYLHLRNEKIKSKICCPDDGETLNNISAHASRRLVNINQYKCKNCGNINNFCTTRLYNLKEEYVDDNKNDDDDDDDDDNVKNNNSDDYKYDDDDDDNDDNMIVDDDEHRTHIRRNAILFISKWTIFKLVTELFLWARCWFWGYCEKPWYILWNTKNKISNTFK
ncbi:ORF31 [Spodoptera exigua multiple nucleopolyhedrovirus]|uniref:ORF31 n=1 Tax=Spodoptera exigua nuclear polyhedrosis virus (strain US) TaxID=31506 RepID=Q9J8A4_NPVSE|nr:ORF31 [Spodoptera exigua multiple nucleopolyhedrovirus]AAF33561.1 ORF31 [Spodoptera exigua multiple nucleopolyhedrovirus]